MALLRTFADQAVIAIENCAPIQGAAGAHRGADEVGGSAHGARRSRASDQLDARPGDSAEDHRTARRAAHRTRRRFDLRVRRARRGLSPARRGACRGGGARGVPQVADPAGRRAVGRCRATRSPWWSKTCSTRATRAACASCSSSPGRVRCSPCRSCEKVFVGALAVQPQLARAVRARGGRSPQDLRHAVGGRDPEREAVPGDPGEGQAARGRRASTSRSSSPA